MSKAKLERGKKWSIVLAENEFRAQTIPGHVKEVEWIKSQKSIMEDIEFYKNFLEEEKKKEKTKSAVKK